MIKRVSLKDIANKVGVSSALVSYVLNEKFTGRINKNVAQKIRETAVELNYRTNQIARSLKTSRTNTIGLIVADISNPFSSSMARVIEDEAAKVNFTVIFGSTDENPTKSEKLVDTFLNRHVDGLIIAPRENTENVVQNLIKQEVPFVLVDRYFPSIHTNYVALDNFKATYEAVEFLSMSGFENIAMINYQTSLFNLNERTRGYLTALGNHTPNSGAMWLKEVDNANVEETVIQSIDELWTADQRPNAIIFASNEIALHGLKQIMKLGIKVPKELAVITFDQLASWDIFYSPLTYIKQPLQEMGQLATQILLDCIEGDKKIQQYLIPGSLVKRDSTKK
ncbi:MAG: substrate-binding domain-containing protein [Ferruginibacter sp.]